MGKTLSLKLNSEEEHIVNQIIKQGISPSELLREALLHYFSMVNREVNHHLQGEKVDQVNQKVNRLQEGEVNLKNKKVNLLRENEVNLVNHEVNRLQEGEVNLKNKKVNLLREEKVNQVNQYDKYLDLYIDQLNSNINHLKEEAKEWKNKYDGEVQYIKDSYSALQNEYHAHVKDSIKRIDDKFDRLMFYLEESRKPALQATYIKPESREPDATEETLRTEEIRHIEKPKKGFVFKMYRM